MIDTIGIFIIMPLDEFVRNIVDHSKLSADRRRDNAYWLDNLRVIGKYNCTLIEGSLARFYWVSNLKNLPILGIHYALNKLVSVLNISPSELLLYRIDIGEHFFE
jgi:hypothetical protein